MSQGDAIKGSRLERWRRRGRCGGEATVGWHVQGGGAHSEVHCSGAGAQRFQPLRRRNDDSNSCNIEHVTHTLSMRSLRLRCYIRVSKCWTVCVYVHVGRVRVSSRNLPFLSSCLRLESQRNEPAWKAWRVTMSRTVAQLRLLELRSLCTRRTWTRTTVCSCKFPPKACACKTVQSRLASRRNGYTRVLTCDHFALGYGLTNSEQTRRGLRSQGAPLYQWVAR